MSDMKCPICNSNLIITRLCDGIFPNPNKGKIDEIFCDKCKMHGTKEIWEALINERQHATDCQDLFIEAIAQKLEIETELDHTRNALDVAVDVVKEIDELLSSNRFDVKETPLLNITQTKISMLLRCINIEQKESAFVHNKIEFPEYNDGLLEEFDKQFFENGQDDDLTETALEQKDK